MEQASAVESGRTRPTPAPDECVERILIADDNPANLLLLRRILAKEPCSLLEAEDGESALKMALEHTPDLVLLDVMMPGLDGYEVSLALKQDPDLSEVPVIFLSALSDASSKIKGLEAGAVDYITKPFNKDEVLARVRNQLKLRGLTRELRKANRDLNEKQRRIDEDLRAAAAIQRSLLPSHGPATDKVIAAWRFLPCDQNAGDLFAFNQLTQNDFAFHVIDVSGHGVPAAMMTVALSQSLATDNGHTMQPADDGGPPRVVSPAEVLNHLDVEYPIDRFERHFTIAYMLLELDSGVLRYSRAGHPMPFIVRRNGRLEELSAGGTIIGLGGVVPFDEGECRLESGDRLFVYTDGIPEAANATGAFFGEDAMYRVLQEARDLPLDDACGALIDAVEKFAGTHDFDDDVTLFAIEYDGTAGADEPRAEKVKA